MTRYFFILTAFCLSLAAPAQSRIDVLHYKYSIELSDNNDTIYGKAEILFIAKKGMSKVEFDLSGGLPGSHTGMNVITTRMPYRAPYSSDVPNIFTHTNNKVSINAWMPVVKDDTLQAIIEYKGIPDDGLIISKNKYGHRTFFADNWPNRAHDWIPCVDDPADKASVEFIVTAPSHYQVVSNGVQMEETDLPGNKKLTHWKEDVPLPTKVMVIGVADFAVNYAGNVDCVQVYSWVFPENKKEGFYDYAQAKDILAFYTGYIGPYPYKKLANVQSKTIFGGMENAGAIFYAENSVNGSRQEEDLLAHEISHQWFGDMATEKSFAHIWLSEGFATYLTHIYDEAKHGTKNFISSMQSERDEVIDFVKSSHKPVVDSISPYRQLLNANSYQKGSWVLHMLRRELGDSVFRKSIRKYYETYAGRNADTRDFQEIVESVSGKDLEKFFTQWLYTPENPDLKISWKYDEKDQLILLTVDQLQQHLFEFPLDIAVQSATPRAERLLISRKTETFKIPVKGKPQTIIPDPSTSLLFEATVAQVK